MKKSLLFAIAAITIIACSSDKKTKLEQLKKQYEEIGEQIKTLEKELIAEGGIKATEKSTKVSVTTLKKQKFQHFVDVQGKVDGDENVAVSAQTLGIISKILVTEGQAVKKGQTLIELDASVMKKGIEELKSSLQFVTDVYNKQKELWDQKIGSEIQYLQAKNNKESLENKLKTLNEQLEMSEVKSPIDGTVEEIPVKVGQALSPGFPAARVVNFAKVKVVADVAEAYTAKIREGNDVVVFFPDLEKEQTSKITFTSKFINPVNRTFLVETRLSPGETEFRANMIAVIKIIDYSADSAIVIPVNLVQSDQNGKFVWTSYNETGKNIAKKIPVTTGRSYNGQIEILTGLKENDTVILTGINEVEDGGLLSF